MKSNSGSGRNSTRRTATFSDAIMVDSLSANADDHLSTLSSSSFNVSRSDGTLPSSSDSMEKANKMPHNSQSTPALPAAATITVMDSLGHDEQREVSVDDLKSRFFMLGLQTGLALQQFVLCIVIVVASQDPQSAADELSGLYYPLFRGIFLFTWFGVMYGVLLFLWKRTGVDYATLLGVPSSSHNYHAVIRSSFTLASVNFACFVIYFLTLAIDLTPDKNWWPALALLGTLLYVGWPIDILPEWRDASQRAALARTIIRVLCAPFSTASFGHTFVADIFCSMPKCFSDVLYVTCIYYTGDVWAHGEWQPETKTWSGGESMTCTPTNEGYQFALIVLSVLPFWLRLMQCVRGWYESGATRHIANGIKYTSSITVIALSYTSGRSFAWLAFSIISTLYALLWDIIVDWGLGPRRLRSFVHGEAAAPYNSVEDAWLLRPSGKRVFSTWVYYMAIVVNTLCRLGWAVYISNNSKVIAQHMTLVLGAVELYRRAQWALLRVEWEQIKRAAEEADARLSGLRESLLTRGESAEAVQERMVAAKIQSNKKRMMSVYTLPEMP